MYVKRLSKIKIMIKYKKKKFFLINHRKFNVIKNKYKFKG